MKSFHLTRLILPALFLYTTAERLSAASPAGAKSAPSLAPRPKAASDAKAMSARIDQLVATRWTGQNVRPGPLANDAEFFRRLSLDLNGRIPTLRHVRDFLDDPRPNKRRIWANKLMDGRDPDFRFVDRELADLYVNHFTHLWRNVLFAQTTNMQQRNLEYQIEPWLKGVLQKNMPYDRMAFEFLTQYGRPFYAANENKPEVVAGSIARVFLGMKLECAQCHEDRSGGAWTQEQFWEYAAFFGGRRARQEAAKVFAPTIDFPGTKRAIPARFLDGQKHAWKTSEDPRTVLAAWLTAPANPYFARAAVNRVWYGFFGIGLTDPVDFMGIEANPPSHPELLDELADQFVANKYDLKYLIRAITGSQAYQRTSARSHARQDEPRLYARMTVRGLTPDQLFDSVQLAAGRPDLLQAFMNQYRDNPRAEFIEKYLNRSDKRTETQTSILQALYLMNNKFIAGLSTQPGGAVEAIAQAGAGASLNRRLDDLFLVVLSRKPRPDELKRMHAHLETEGPAGQQAWADIHWALLNSPEFLLNH